MEKMCPQPEKHCLYGLDPSYDGNGLFSCACALCDAISDECSDRDTGSGDDRAFITSAKQETGFLQRIIQQPVSSGEGHESNFLWDHRMLALCAVRVRIIMHGISRDA